MLPLSWTYSERHVATDICVIVHQDSSLFRQVPSYEKQHISLRTQLSQGNALSIIAVMAPGHSEPCGRFINMVSDSGEGQGLSVYAQRKIYFPGL